jgi:ubiquinone/menaquinone biosynthesis C-methylase UbiE
VTIDHYAAEARFYDVLASGVTQDDLPFYLDTARSTGGPVLELACGTGRILLPLVNEVGQGVGIDLSASMIELARKKAAKQGIADQVRLECGDIRSAEAGEVFPLVTIPYSSLFQLPTLGDLVAALTTARRHAAADGLVVADVFIPNTDNMRTRQDRLSFVDDVEDPDSGSRLVVWEHTLFKWREKKVIRRRIYEHLDRGGVVTARRHGVLHIYFRQPDVVLDAFQQAGLHVLHAYGDFDRRPLEPDSPRLIVLASPTPSPK